MIDKSVGIELLGGDEELYMEILADYVDESKEMLENVVSAYNAEDWKNYSIHVHGLKSASKSVGAMKLFDIALALEMASKEMRLDEVKAKHPELIKIHADTLSYIESEMQ